MQQQAQKIFQDCGFADINMDVIKVPGDGGCMLHSLAIGLWLKSNPDKTLKDFKFEDFSTIKTIVHNMRQIIAKKTGNPNLGVSLILVAGI